MRLVSASALTKRVGEMTAVDDVSLSVNRGEVVDFLGPNGAGKSTTMMMIAGFLERDAGTAAICGHDVWQDPVGAKARLGYLPAGAPAYGDMPVADFLKFCGRMRGLRRRRQNDRLAEMVERVEVQEVWSRPVDALSKGFRRRVAIAQALLHDPDVLILDEPTDGLDPNQKHHMRALIRAIAPEKAIIVSTHILEEVEAVCSRAVIIARGKVVADAEPQELMEKAAGGRAIRVTVAEAEEARAIEQLRRHTGGAEIEVMDHENGTARVLVRVGDRPVDAADLAG